MSSLDYGLWNLVAVEVVAPVGWRELEDLRLNGRDVNSLFPCRLPDGYESVIRVLPVQAVEYFVTEVAYTLGRVPLERLMDARRVSEFTVRQVMGAARDEADLMGSRTKSSASRPDVEILSPLGLGSRVFVRSIIGYGRDYAGIRLYLGIVGKGRPKTLGAPMQGVLGALAAVLVTIRFSGASAGSFGVWVVGLVRSGVLCPPTLAQMLTI